MATACFKVLSRQLDGEAWPGRIPPSLLGAVPLKPACCLFFVDIYIKQARLDEALSNLT